MLSGLHPLRMRFFGGGPDIPDAPPPPPPKPDDDGALDELARKRKSLRKSRTSTSDLTIPTSGNSTGVRIP